jgi:GTP cyclohydrolase I
MPIKKTESEILYAQKCVSAESPHPTIVGCGDIFLPIKILNKNGDSYTSSCCLNVEVNLNNSVNGANFNKIPDYFLSGTFLTLENLIDDVQNNFFKKNECSLLKMRVDFPYFSSKVTPVSNKKCIYKHDSCISIVMKDQEKKYFLETSVPYASLCPASKEISDYGAHNQRGYAFLKVELKNLDSKNGFWIEDLIKIVDDSCSSPVYNMSNLQDEAYQTEQMYENSMFIEEIAKNISIKLEKARKKYINSYSIRLSQKESINTYETYAKIESGDIKNDT